MARVSIYVSDEMKARMSEAGDALNWSDIARPAFEAALAAYSHRKDKSVQTAIERLRASKAQHVQEQTSDAKQNGRAWAADDAEFAQLKRVADIDADALELLGDAWSSIRNATDPEGDLTVAELCNELFGDEDNRDDEWLIAWIKGAQEFYAEVADQL